MLQYPFGGCLNFEDPLCDDCGDDRCVSKIDTLCSIYHLNTDIPSKLTNLGFGNGANLEEILERIDVLVGTSFNIPLTVISSPSLILQNSGIAGHTLTGYVPLSQEPGNSLQIYDDGFYVPSCSETYQVKVDASGAPGYLYDKINTNTIDGIISLDKVIEDDQVVLTPVLNFCLLTQALLNSDDFITAITDKILDALINSQEFLDLFSEAIINTIINNEEFLQTLTEAVLDAIINNQELLDQLTNALLDNILNNQEFLDLFCGVSASCGSGCTQVSFSGSTVIPDALVGVPYSFEVGLIGKAPFDLTILDKPDWMTITLAGYKIVFGGTPAGGDVGTGIPVELTVGNCGEDVIDITETINVAA